MKKELLKFVKDHLKHFGFYPIEFEYKNKIYNYDFIIRTIQESEQNESNNK